MLNTILPSICADFEKSCSDLIEALPPAEWTPAVFRRFVGGLKDAVNAAGRSALLAAVAAAEVQESEVEVGERRFTVKERAEKEWLTPFGRVLVSRRYFRPVDRLGSGFCPLDVRCGMQGRYMTQDVEEFTAYSCAYMVTARSSA